jgi:hypothetical protein
MAQTYRFIVFSIRIYYNFHYTESEKRMSDLMVNIIPSHFFGILHSRVGAGAAGAASKFSPGAGAT